MHGTQFYICLCYTLMYLVKFFEASIFNQDISNWDVSKVQDFSEMVSFDLLFIWTVTVIYPKEQIFNSVSADSCETRDTDLLVPLCCFLDIGKHDLSTNIFSFN
jgi:surface protein